MPVLIGQSIFGPKQEILTANGKISMKSGMDIHGVQRMGQNEFGDLLTILVFTWQHLCQNIID